MAYSPLAVSNYFDQRIRDFYSVPPGIAIQLWDLNFGLADKDPEWHVQIANVDHETPWHAPWGRIDGNDFSRVFRIIAVELEQKFGVVFPRVKKEA